MKDRRIMIGQYAYTRDGDIIRIDEINEDEKKYKGFAINQTGYPRIVLTDSDIYGIAGRVYRAGVV